MDSPIIVTLDGKTSIPELIDELTYRSYAYNRLRAPEIKPADWARIFPNVPEMEKRFQAEAVEREKENS